MSDAYKIFRQIQEKDKKAKQYTNYEKEDLIDEITELQEREEQLQNNWNELKNWLDNICFYDNDTITYEQISDKIQELEGNNENL